MNKPLTRFWSSLERVPDLALVDDGWRRLLGDPWAAGRFLLPTNRIAKSIQCSVPGRNCVHDVRPWKQQYLAVCPDGCDTTTLTRDQIVIHRLDVARLARELAGALGLEAVAAEALAQPAGVWRIGDYVPLAGYRFPVYLTFTGEPDALRSAAEGLATRGVAFVLTAPTRSALTQPAVDVIQRARSVFLSLQELVGDSTSGLCLLQRHTPQTIFADLSAMHLPQPAADDGMVVFPTPAGASWADVSIRFIDRHSVYVTVQSATGKYHCAQLGMASKKNAMPTKQWLLLELFAEGAGLLDWSNRKADRKNQKRKELLAADLRRFFRIDSDPFIIDGNGWRTRFSLSMR